MITKDRVSSLVMNIEDGAGDPGAGGEEKPLTRAEVNSLLDAKINGAMKNWGPRITKGLSEELASIKTAIEGFTAKQTDQGNGEGAPAKSGAQVDDEVTRQLKRLQADNEALAARLKAQDEQTKAERAKLARQEERNALANELRKHVRPELLDAAVALHAERGTVARAEDGTIKVKVTRPYGDDFVSLEEGVKEWATSEQGKVYAPPVEARGSGTTTSGQSSVSLGGIPLKDGKMSVEGAFGLLATLPE